MRYEFDLPSIFVVKYIPFYSSFQLRYHDSLLGITFLAQGNGMTNPEEANRPITKFPIVDIQAPFWNEAMGMAKKVTLLDGSFSLRKRDQFLLKGIMIGANYCGNYLQKRYEISFGIVY
jgi:hypothetical protein